MRSLLIICLGLCLLSACGQKGPLVRPQPARSSGAQQAAPETRPAAEPAAPPAKP